MHLLKLNLHCQDYLASGDAKEAEKGLQALAVPFFHHEFVRQAVSNAIHNVPKQAAILQLLQGLTESGIVSTNLLIKVSNCYIKLLDRIFEPMCVALTTLKLE